MASKQEIQNVIDATDIVSLVSEYVKLDKQGKNYKGLCPFHHEDTPSFVVNQEKKLAHCFGCGGGGDPIKFLMQIENINYGDAISRLAKRSGIKLTNAYENTRPNPLTKYFQIMQTAQAFYKKFIENSESGKEALNYLYKRGLDDETIKVFGIGLAPMEPNLLYQVLKESNYLELDMADLGLVDKNNHGYYDIFTRRIMFPIYNEMGGCLGFSGRIYNTTDKNQPKYVNSRDTILFKKKDVLFNLHLAKGEILKKKRVILHEGQMDVIASYRSGLKEAVCTMGTALSLEQAMILKKYTNHAIICYDGDKAGINASLKAINIFQQAGFIVHLVLLPNGADPDEFVLKNGTKAYADYFENNMLDANSYIFEQALLNKNFNDETVIEAVKTQIFEMIYRSNSSTVMEEYLNKLASKLNVSINALGADYNKYCNIYAPSNVVDNYVEDKNNLDYVKPIKKLDDILNFEIRLFMYAKSSKEKALYIDNTLNDRMEALSKENQNLWISLINGYYEMYQEFDEMEFINTLSEETKAHYYKIMEILKKDKLPYTDENLNDCLEKLRLVKLVKQHQNIDTEFKLSDDQSKKLKLVADKFNIKKQQENLKKMRRK